MKAIRNYLWVIVFSGQRCDLNEGLERSHIRSTFVSNALEQKIESRRICNQVTGSLSGLCIQSFGQHCHAASATAFQESDYCVAYKCSFLDLLRVEHCRY